MGTRFSSAVGRVIGTKTTTSGTTTTGTAPPSVSTTSATASTAAAPPPDTITKEEIEGLVEGFLSLYTVQRAIDHAVTAGIVTPDDVANVEHSEDVMIQILRAFEECETRDSEALDNLLKMLHTMPTGSLGQYNVAGEAWIETQAQIERLDLGRSFPCTRRHTTVSAKRLAVSRPPLGSGFVGEPLLKYVDIDTGSDLDWSDVSSIASERESEAGVSDIDWDKEGAPTAPTDGDVVMVT
jgi:hypothetical protein